MNFLHDGQPELLTKRTIIWLCVIVLAYSVCMFFRLGTVEIPQTCVRLNPGDMFSVTVDVQKISSCLVWSKYGGFTDSNNSANEHVVQSQLTFQVDGQVLGYIDTWHTKWIRCDLISSNHESSMLDIVYEGDHFFDLYEIAFLDDAQNLIPYQVEAESGPTGTDARVIQMSREGVAAGLVSIPLRYMHTPHEMVALSDVEATVRLLAEFIRSLKPSDTFKW